MMPSRRTMAYQITDCAFATFTESLACRLGQAPYCLVLDIAPSLPNCSVAPSLFVGSARRELRVPEHSLIAASAAHHHRFSHGLVAYIVASNPCASLLTVTSFSLSLSLSMPIFLFPGSCYHAASGCLPLLGRWRGRMRVVYLGVTCVVWNARSLCDGGRPSAEHPGRTLHSAADDLSRGRRHLKQQPPA